MAKRQITESQQELPERRPSDTRIEAFAYVAEELRSRISLLQQLQDRQDLSREELLAYADFQTALEELHIQQEQLISTHQEVEAQHRRYRELFEFAPEPYLVTDKNGTIEEANPSAAKLLDVPGKGLIGKPLSSYIDPSGLKAFRSRLRRLGEMDGIQEWETRVLSRQGRVFHAAITVSAIRDSSGQVSSYRWLLRDIEEKKQAEDLRFQKALLESQSEASSDGILVVSREGKILSFNQRFIELWEIPEAVIAAKSDAKALRSIEAKLINPNEFLDRVSYLYAHPNEESRDEILLKDGRTFERYSAPVLGTDGIYHGRRWSFRNISDRKRTEQRLATQNSITIILAESPSVEDAYPRILQTVCETLNWDAGAAWSQDLDEHILRCVEFWCRPSMDLAEFEEISRSKTVTPGIGLPGRVWVSGKPSWVGDVMQDDNFTSTPIAEKSGLHGAFAFPILLGGEALGVIEFFSREKRELDEELLATMAVIGSQVGQFIERKRVEHRRDQLLVLEREARAEAESAYERLGLLAEASKVFSSSLNPETTLHHLARLAVPSIADCCIVYLPDAATQINRVQIVCMDPQKEELIRQLEQHYPPDPSAASGVGKVLSTGEPDFRAEILTERLEAFARDKKHYELLRDLALQSLMVVPLVARGQVLGAITFAMAESGRRYSEKDLSFAQELALRAAQNLDNGQLYRLEQVSRLASEAAQLRLAFLAEASLILGSSLDYETTLSNVAELAVRQFADWCAVDIIENGDSRRVVVAHNDPVQVQMLQEMQERYPTIRDPEYGIGKVLRTGAAEFYPEVPESLLAASAQDDEHLRLIKALGLKSAMIVPVKTLDETFGAITFVLAEPRASYNQDDLALAQELARRAGVAIENARLYRESQQVQADLRRANEAKDEFLSLISHEMRTPITTIYGGASLLKARDKELDAASRLQLLMNMEHESERLSNIVSDMLVLARIELGEQAETEPVLVQHLAESLVGQFGRRRSGPIQLHVDEVVPPVAAAPVYLDQVLRNLLGNADKYSPPDAPIDILVRPKGTDQVMISVSDQGPGVAPEELERIFERFYRVPGTGKDGTGIGLTVCKRLIEAQSGHIWAQLREGGGLEVCFTLPAYQEQ